MTYSVTVSMAFYATKTPDGLYHVQNIIQGMRGQHHIHSPESFERWRTKDGQDTQVEVREGPCDCGLGIGQVREYDGKVWYNDRFL